MPTASGNAGVAQRELAAVQIALLPDRPGQLLRQALQERLQTSNGVARRYDLAVDFRISGEGIGIQQDNTVTRVRFIGNATWSLNSQDPSRTRLTTGAARAVDAENILDSQYFAADLEGETVQKRIAGAIADQIAMQLAVYFRKRAAAATQS